MPGQRVHIWPPAGNGGVDNRMGEAWPTVDLKRDQEFLPQSPTEMAKMDALRQAMAPPPPVTPMGNELGMQDLIRMQQFQQMAAPDLYGGYSGPSAGVRGMDFPPAPAPPPANIQAPEAQGYGGPLPQISAEQFGPKPQFNMGVTLPTSAGDFSARGSYTSPQEWKALLGLRREF